MTASEFSKDGQSAQSVSSPTETPTSGAEQAKPMAKSSDESNHAQRERFFLRVRFSEFGKIRFISHRDVARLFERALRKLSLPVAYSEGFSPRPKLSFGLALSVGYESEAEYLDIELTEKVPLQGLRQRFTEAMPDGITVTEIVELEAGAASLQQSIVSCMWHLEILGVSEAEMEQVASSTMAATELPIERVRKGKTKTTDVRPAILGVEVVGPTDNGVAIAAHLATEQLSMRPSELLVVLGVEPTQEGRVTRTHQWMNVDGVRCEPVGLPEPSAKNETHDDYSEATESQGSTVSANQLHRVS